MIPGTESDLPTQIIEPCELPELLRQAATYLSNIQHEVYHSRGATQAHQHEKAALETRINELQTALAEKDGQCKALENSEAALKTEVGRLQQCQQLQTNNAMHDVKRDMQALENQIRQFQQQHSAVIAQSKKKAEEHEQQLMLLRSQLEKETTRYKQLELQHKGEKKRAEDAIDELNTVKKALRKTRAACEAMQKAFKRAKRDGNTDSLTLDAATEADLNELSKQIDDTAVIETKVSDLDTDKGKGRTKDRSLVAETITKPTVTTVVPVKPAATDTYFNNVQLQQTATTLLQQQPAPLIKKKESTQKDVEDMLVTQPERLVSSRSSKVVAENEQQQQITINNSTHTLPDIEAQTTKQQRQLFKEIRDPPPQRQLGKKREVDAHGEDDIILFESPLDAMQMPPPPPRQAAFKEQLPAKKKYRSPAWKTVQRNEDNTNAANDDFDFSPQRIPHQQQRNLHQQVGGGAVQQTASTSVQRDDSSNSGAMVAEQQIQRQWQQQGYEPGYKFQEVVRKKDEREKLQAFECEECRRFYAAVEQWGAMGIGDLPRCGHVEASRNNNHEKAGKVTNELCQDVGRHRYRYQPPATPKGFWHVGFSPE